MIAAAVWSLGGFGLAQVLRLASNLLLTRLLVPDMFGLMAIANVVLLGLNLFSDLGLRVNIVQSKRGGERAFLNTVWSVQIVRGVLLWLMALLIALLVLPLANHIGTIPHNSVYADQRLPSVIAILSVSAVISGFTSTKMSEASRALALGGITRIELIAQISGLLFVLCWVYFDRSVWALVFGNLASAVVRVVLSHTSLPGVENRWHWDKSALSEILHFGKWLFLSSILTFGAANGDRLILGGLIDTFTLGVYAIAVMMVSSVEQVLNRLVSGIAFPALSEILRERGEKLHQLYYRVHLPLALFIYFCAGALMTAGESLIRLLYDPRYAPSGWMVEILAIGLLTLPFQVVVQYFLAAGRPQLNSCVLGVRLITLILAMPIGFHYFGLRGAIYGSVLSQFACVPIILRGSIKSGIFNLARELISLPMIAVGVGAGEIFVILTNHWHVLR